VYVFYIDTHFIMGQETKQQHAAPGNCGVRVKCQSKPPAFVLLTIHPLPDAANGP
jgi:hypothetical protein